MHSAFSIQHSEFCILHSAFCVSARAFAAVTICACLVGWSGPVEAWSGTVYSATAAGTNLTVDTRWVDGAGYRPVRVTLTPTAPTTVDKTFTVEFLLRRRPWPDDRHDLRVARDIELPAGSGPVQATVSLPQYPDCDSYTVNVLEDGKLQPRLCIPWTQYANTATDWAECLPALLVVGDTIPDTHPLAELLPLEDYFSSQTVRRFNQRPFPSANVVSQMASIPQTLPGVVSYRIAELPQRWIDYSSVDVVCISLGQLEEVAGKNPAALRAVLQWTAAGGNLWVSGAGQDWQHVPKIENFLRLATGETPVPPATGETPVPLAELTKWGWKPPDKEAYLKAVQGGLSEVPVAERRYPPYVMPPPRVPIPEAIPPAGTGTAQPRVGKAPTQAQFLFRPYDMGLIVALASGDPFQDTADQWRGVLNTVGPDRWLWCRRHGLSMVRQNPDYWNLLIPGVGLVPVAEFCVLITLFVVGIGPLNYWLLRRWGRLHLLVVTIPLGAATVTVALFAYAVVADGLGTRVRVRSVTRLDQGRGQAVCWARLSYYAGLAPRRGLTFPDDVLVLPLEYAPVPDYRDPPLRRELIWREGQQGEQQWFASGWLSSRTPAQLLTVRSRPSRLGLQLIRSPGNPGPPQIRNGLGTRIEQLVVCSDDRKLYWAEGIDADQTVPLEQFTPQAGAKFWEVFRSNQPQVPEGIQTRYYGSGGVFGLRYYRSPYGNPAIAPPTQQTSRLEASLADVQTLAGAGFSLLEPGSYVAVVEQSPEVVLGVASARQEASYHVILGKW